MHSWSTTSLEVENWIQQAGVPGVKRTLSTQTVPGSATAGASARTFHVRVQAPLAKPIVSWRQSVPARIARPPISPGKLVELALKSANPFELASAFHQKVRVPGPVTTVSSHEPGSPP